jgi:hypothetical protein
MISRVATASLLLAEAMVVATFAEFLAASYSGAMPHAVAAWAFAVTALAGFVVPRFVEGFDLPAGRAYAITGTVGLLLTYALTRMTVVGDVAIWDLSWIGDFLRDSQEAAQRGGHAIVGAVLLLVVWARANLRAADDIEMETMPRLVTIPFAITTAVVILGAMGDRSGEVGRAGAAFYVFAVLALVCSQLSLSGATYGDMRAGGTAGILLAGTAAVALAALLVIGLFVAVLGPVIGPLISATVKWTLTIILTPFAWALTWFFELIFRGASPLPDIQQQVINRSQEAGHPDGEKSTATRVSAFFMRMVALTLLIAGAALVATVFARMRRRQRQREDEGREVSAIGDLRSDLGSMFRSLFRRPQTRAAGEATTETTRLYLEVLAKAESRGHARESGSTAREFAPVLQDAFADPVTDDITRAFEAARYAGREPDARTLGELRRRWER